MARKLPKRPVDVSREPMDGRWYPWTGAGRPPAAAAPKKKTANWLPASGVAESTVAVGGSKAVDIDGEKEPLIVAVEDGDHANVPPSAEKSKPARPSLTASSTLREW